MNHSSLAIIIPFYKIIFFEDTLKSIYQQTNQNFNVYIGSDDSPSDPTDLINKYNVHGNIFFEKFKNNLGGKGRLVEHWNRCISLSKNEDWLMILADDDYISNNFVEEFYNNVNHAQGKNIHLLRFKMRRVSEDNQFMIDLEQPEFLSATQYVWDDEKHIRFLSISENVFSRKAFREKGFRNYPLAWRIPFMMYLDFTECGNVLGINNAFVAIRKSNQQLSWRKDVDQYKKKAMQLCYRDVLKEYSHNFSKLQNLQFLKVYKFYSQGTNEIGHSFVSLFLRYGGMKELVKFLFKSLLKK